jgi:hypothetical protein
VNFSTVPLVGLSFVLAQIPEANPSAMTQWLVNAAALGAIALIFLKIIDHFKPKPALGVQMKEFAAWCDERYATRKELRDAQDLNKEMRDIKTREIDGIFSRMREIDEKMASLPHKVIALLRETKGLI